MMYMLIDLTILIIKILFVRFGILQNLMLDVSNWNRCQYRSVVMINCGGIVDLVQYFSLGPVTKVLVL
jgi:hypothetical protein